MFFKLLFAAGVIILSELVRNVTVYFVTKFPGNKRNLKP